MPIRCLCPALLIALAPAAYGQGAVTVPGSERLLMRSQSNGIEYQLDIALPAGYATSADRYPVFYILDGNMAFATATDTYRGYRITGTVPAMIIVGIGYPEDDPAVYSTRYHQNRSRDYTPTTVEAALPGSGKAPAFLQYLKTELFPLIDGRYRTDPTDRGLGGHSLGGLFTSYALLHEPTLFKRYWIGSPSLWWDGEGLFKDIAPARARADQPTGRVFLSVGAEEAALMVTPMQRLAARLKLTFPALQVSSTVYPNEDHMSVVGGAISRALRRLYTRTSIALSSADLAGYAGTWRSAEGETMTIRVVGRGLTVSTETFRVPLTSPLAAETRDRLYAPGAGVELYAERDGTGRVTTLRRTQLGTETTFTRAS